MSPMDIAPALEALDRHADKLRAELDTVATIRKMLLATLDIDEPGPSPEAPAPSVGWVSLSDVLIEAARACPVCRAPAGSPCLGVRAGVTHLDRFLADEPTPEPPTPSADPLDHRCPACGALPGTDCVGLDFGVFHSARPGTGWRQERNPGFAQPYDVACPHCLAAIGVKCASPETGQRVAPHESRHKASDKAARRG